MADIKLHELKEALIAEGVKVKEEILNRVFRKLANPQGCEACGQHVKVGVAQGDALVTACCGEKIADLNPTQDKGA